MLKAALDALYLGDRPSAELVEDLYRVFDEFEDDETHEWQQAMSMQAVARRVLDGCDLAETRGYLAEEVLTNYRVEVGSLVLQRAGLTWLPAKETDVLIGSSPEWHSIVAFLEVLLGEPDIRAIAASLVRGSP